ncbi:hypothetical protein [Taylorella equigenitalis]|uniref:Membrane protein n=2 Tax=Taylorella equigenitalis TaxID=29575 RepID=A0ABN4AVN8_9BURK|nr:hypothetical protein [Taylorella equigenitalis]AFN35610.1 putative membrane protein [Taylorella equigenitalis ATCC 35865]ASY37565.1 hypothetical protein CA605_02425 [Taylorella equigenitalis]ASY39034.1 hypothetical protein CA604_02600 [Taylorella equigenitalis]ASY41988.1 hypothetical protein CA943_02435 [Taylorella equigenitalis]KGK33136.1 hypothetical protein LW90_05520 [Taylorella equigenitalis]
MYSLRKTPARLASPAASKLPRRILFWVMFAFIFAGLFGRDPWKTEDAAGFASMLTLVNQFDFNFSNWITTHISDINFYGEGPLNSIIGAISISIFSPLLELTLSPLDAQINAARIPNVAYYFLFLWGIWYGTYLLGRRKEAQPLPLSFGGEPKPKDYGRMLADVAFFFGIATVGIIIRMHETSYYPLLMALHSIAFYGFVRIIDNKIQGLIALSLSFIGSLAAIGLIGALPLIVVGLLLLTLPAYDTKTKITLSFVFLITLACFAGWAFYVSSQDPIWFEGWLKHNFKILSGSELNTILIKIRDLSWYLWPSWPFALIAIYKWRRWILEFHILIPFLFYLVNLLIIFFVSPAYDLYYGPILFGNAVLAAMSIPTLKRNAINILDWFSIMTVSIALISVWFGWMAMQTGWPHKIHFNIMRLVNGYEVTIDWLSVFAGIVVSALWIMLVNWRIRKQPRGLWRGLIVTAAGLTCVWFLLSLLWLPLINYGRSYRSTGEELNRAVKGLVPPNSCVNPIDLGLGQLAVFNIFSNLKFSNNECDFAMIQANTHTNHVNKIQALIDDSQILWQGHRASERHGEYFIFLKK